MIDDEDVELAAWLMPSGGGWLGVILGIAFVIVIAIIAANNTEDCAKQKCPAGMDAEAHEPRVPLRDEAAVSLQIGDRVRNPRTGALGTIESFQAANPPWHDGGCPIVKPDVDDPKQGAAWHNAESLVAWEGEMRARITRYDPILCTDAFTLLAMYDVALRKGRDAHRDGMMLGLRP